MLNPFMRSIGGPNDRFLTSEPSWLMYLMKGRFGGDMRRILASNVIGLDRSVSLGLGLGQCAIVRSSPK
jgi:hypothetical protein